MTNEVFGLTVALQISPIVAYRFSFVKLTAMSKRFKYHFLIGAPETHNLSRRVVYSSCDSPSQNLKLQKSVYKDFWELD